MSVNVRGVDQGELLYRLINAANDKDKSERLAMLLNAAREMLKTAAELRSQHVSKKTAGEDSRLSVQNDRVDETAYDRAYGEGAVQDAVDQLHSEAA
jgi:hypothetical protein